MSKDDIKLLDIVKLSTELQKMILTWRNDDNVRQWMLDKQQISIEKHLEFIKNLKNSINNQYYLVQKNDVYIGVIYYQQINLLKNKASIGLYAKPNSKMLGDTLLKSAINHGFNNLNLNTINIEVLKKNIKARKLYDRFNFKEIKQSNNLIYMELKNENRNF